MQEHADGASAKIIVGFFFPFLCLVLRRFGAWKYQVFWWRLMPTETANDRIMEANPESCFILDRPGLHGNSETRTQRGSKSISGCWSIWS